MSGSTKDKTMLCTCSAPECLYPHATAELRRPGESSLTGRHPNQDIKSLDRSRRWLPRICGHKNPKTSDKRRDNDNSVDLKFDERSDSAGGLKGGKGIENRAKDGRNAQKVDILTSRIQELEIQLDREKEECRRITSSTKKFVKEYNRFLKAQDDLKRSEARLKELGTQLNITLSRSEGNDAGVVRNLRTSYEPQNELQNTSSLSWKQHYVDQYTTKEPVEDDLRGKGKEVKVESVKKGPFWDMSISQSGAWNEEDILNKPSSEEDPWGRRERSSTRRAAQAADEALLNILGRLQSEESQRKEGSQ